MIQYPATLEEIERGVTELSETWLEDAAERTKWYRKAGYFFDQRKDYPQLPEGISIGSIWSTAKTYFMGLQGESKCAYCELKIEGVISHDVEHFRPKRGVKKWRPRKLVQRILEKEGLTLTPPPDEGGYYLLAHDLRNYAASCKFCNSTMKGNKFPIVGRYDLATEDPREANSVEQPLLVNPVGSSDDDPEDLIEFEAIMPFPRASTGLKRARGIAIIDFFRLNDPKKRKTLFQIRAIMLVALFPQLEKTQEGATAAERQRAEQFVDRLRTQRNLPHLNCCRSFIRLFGRDPAQARAYYYAALDWMAGTSLPARPS